MEYLCKYAKEHHGINDRDHHYLTPLHIAVKSNMPVNVKLLLAYKVGLGSIKYTIMNNDNHFIATIIIMSTLHN
jgi:hypothetical protein